MVGSAMLSCFLDTDRHVVASDKFHRRLCTVVYRVWSPVPERR